jgi:hypothetical protein
MSNDNLYSRTTTEIFLAFYVSSAFLFVIIASMVGSGLLLDTIKRNWISSIVCSVCSILAGTTTYFFRKKIYRFERSLLRDSDLMAKGDLLTIIYTGLLVLLAVVAISLIPISVNPIYILVLIMMIATLGLNTYFRSFWRQTVLGSDTSFNLESLKLEHGEWLTIYNSVIIACVVAFGGIFFTYFTSTTSSLIGSVSHKMYLEGFATAYTVLGPPIICLLRPIHVIMARIRKEITEIQRHV